MIVKRIVNKLVWYLDLAFSRFYHARHPGPFGRGVIAALAPVVSSCLPNDKWNLHVFIPRWMSAIDAPSGPALPKSKSIFIFCVYRGVFTSHLVLATMLAWRGHKVTIGYLPKLQSPNKPPLDDHPSARPYIRFATERVAKLTRGAIVCIDLSEDMAPAQVDSEFVAKQARYDSVMAYQKESLDLSDINVRKLHDHMISIGEKAQIAISNHIRAHSYDICIVGNGTTFEGAHVCHVLKKTGHAVNGTEKFAFRGVRVINHGDHFLAGGDLDYIWQQREQLGYTQEPFLSTFLAKARQSILERSQNSTKTWLWELQRAVNQSEKEALKAANVPEDKPFILICPNVVFDAGFGKITNVFPSMKVWLIQTVKFLLDHSSDLIVVRAHPGEGLYWAGKEPVHELLAQQGLRPSERLVIIPGPAKVNTYRLMERCRFGVVFSSSTGLEMAVLGKNVVTASDIFYAGRGFTHDAGDQAEYFRQLETIVAKPALEPLDEAKQRLALLFYFVYHWVTQYPYPYDKPSNITRNPPAKLLRSDMTPYLAYLDLLSMDEDEFRAQASRYLNAAEILRRVENAN
jgi:hypothetical protein